MDMFTNYENIPTSYIPNNTTVCPPCTVIKTKPLEEYNVAGELVGYSWYYGDQIVLEFITEGNVVYDDLGTWESAEDYFEGKKIQVEFFDFRYECVYSSTLPASTDLKFFIDNRSSQRFVRGAYKCKVTLLWEEEGTPQSYTLMNIDDYIFTIK